MSDQDSLFKAGNWWDDLWVGMLPYEQPDRSPFKTISVKFRGDKSLDDFANLMGISRSRPISKSDSDRWIWFPLQEYNDAMGQRWVSGKSKTRYPIYVISKGRWASRYTSKALEEMGCPYRIVVEPQEYDLYAEVISPEKILTAPENFSERGQGSIPVRNFIWEHSQSLGALSHWCVDDNICRFYRLPQNTKIPFGDCTPFSLVEEFSDRYENVALSGFQYEFFAPRRSKIDPITLNTRIYSCILIKNDIPFRWRGRYNEDTDLSLRALKAGYCTVLFNAYLAKKSATMTVKGGNTDELYAGDGRLQMAQSLVEQHPDVTKITRKWGRWQHQVDYSPFRGNQLVLRRGAEIPSGVREYGMKVVEIEKGDGAEYEQLSDDPRDGAGRRPAGHVSAGGIGDGETNGRGDGQVDMTQVVYSEPPGVVEKVRWGAPRPRSSRPPRPKKPCRHCGRAIDVAGLRHHETACENGSFDYSGKCEICSVKVPPGVRACSIHVFKDADFLLVDVIIEMGYGDVRWKDIPPDVVSSARSKVKEKKNDRF